MPAARRRRQCARFVVAPAVLLVAAVALAGQPPGGGKKKGGEPGQPAPLVKQPDGTFAPAVGEQVILSPEEHRRLLDQIEQLKKQLAVRRPAQPSECALRGVVERRGETLVAAVTATFSFRTTLPQSAVALGCRKAFLVSAKLDGDKLPVLDAGEDGFATLIETPGDHTLVLNVELPITGRGVKSEVGFELALPRAAITTLALDPPAGVDRVNLTTRTPDPAPPARPADPRRVPGLDVKLLAARPGREQGYPLGPVELLEVTWEPPTAVAAPPDPVRAAEYDIACVLTDTLVETTAKVRLRGAARQWRLVAPAAATVTPERLGRDGEAGPVPPPVVTRPADPAKSVWQIEFPAGAAAADWVFTVVARQPRPKAPDAKQKGPFPVGPFAVADVARQTGTVRVTAAANTRLAYRHGPDLRRTDPPGPADDDTTTGSFKLATGPTGATPAFTPLLQVEAVPLTGAVQVRPTYKLTLRETGWRIRAELKVTPVRTEVDSIAVELPAEWRGVEASPPELVEGIKLVKEATAENPRQVAVIRLATGHRQPFDLILDATLPVPPAGRDAVVPLPRFPGAIERDAAITATVPDGFEVRGAAREWEGDQPAGWGTPLAAIPGPDGKPPRAATTLTGRFEFGAARVDLAWQQHRPETTAEVRADVTVQDRQVLVVEQIRLRSPEGFGRPVRFRGPAVPLGRVGLKAQPPLEQVGPAEWSITPPADAKEATVTVSFAVPLAAHPASDPAPWKLPVGLLTPVGVTRTETTVRVWANTGPGRVIGIEPGAWRELPPEPAADRDALPVLTLAGTADEQPLVLDVREVPDPAAVAVWVDRGLIQAWAGEDGVSQVRARFFLKRWLAGSALVHVPGTQAPTILLDGKKVDQPAEPAGDRVFRVPLPEAKPGRTATLDIRYQLPTGRRSISDAIYVPPVLLATAYTGPVRWQVTVPPGFLPVVTGSAGQIEQRWRWRLGMIAPAAAVTDEELDRWFRAGGPAEGEADEGWEVGDGEPVILRTAGVESVRVGRVPHLGFVVACTLTALVLGLVLMRLPVAAAGVLVVVLAAVVAVATVLFPQPVGITIAAAEPGLVAFLVVFGFQTAIRWRHRRRVSRLPGFSRARVESAVVPPASAGVSSTRSRPSQNGSSQQPTLDPVPPAAG